MSATASSSRRTAVAQYETQSGAIAMTASTSSIARTPTSDWPHSVPASTPTLSGLVTFTPISSSAGSSMTPRSASLPVKPVPTWTTRYRPELVLLMSISSRYSLDVISSRSQSTESRLSQCNSNQMMQSGRRQHSADELERLGVDTYAAVDYRTAVMLQGLRQRPRKSVGRVGEPHGEATPLLDARVLCSVGTGIVAVDGSSVTGDIGIKRARQQDGHAQPVRRQFCRERFRPPFGCSLGRGIHRSQGHSADCTCARHHHDAALPRRSHARQQRIGQSSRTEEVRPEQSTPRSSRCLLSKPRCSNTGVVDEPIGWPNEFENLRCGGRN